MGGTMAIVALLAVVLVAVVIYLVRRLANVERAVRRTTAEVRHQVTPADLHTAFGQWVEANPGAVTTACAPYINRSVAVAASAMRVHAPAPPAPHHPELRQPPPSLSQPPAQPHGPRPGPPPPHFAPQQSHPHHQAPPHPALQSGPVHGSRPAPPAVVAPTQPQACPQLAPPSAPTTAQGHCRGEGQAFELQRPHAGAPPQQAQPPPAPQTAHAAQSAAQTGRPPLAAPLRPQTPHGAPSSMPSGAPRSLPMPRATPPRMRCEGDVCVIIEDEDDDDDEEEEDEEHNDYDANGYDQGHAQVIVGAGDDRHQEDAHDDAAQNGHPLQASVSHLDRCVQDTLDAISHASNDEDEDDERDDDDDDENEDDTTSDKNARGGANGSADPDADRAHLASGGRALDAGRSEPPACASDPWATPDEARFFVGHGDESEGDDDQDDERDQPGGGGWYGHETPSLFIVLGAPTNGLGAPFGGLARARITPLDDDANDDDGDGDGHGDDDDEEKAEDDHQDDDGDSDDDDDQEDMHACRRWAKPHKDQILSVAREADALLKVRIGAEKNVLSLEEDADLLDGDSDSDDERPEALSRVIDQVDDGPAWSLPSDVKEAGHAVTQEDPHVATGTDAEPDGTTVGEHRADKFGADGDQHPAAEASVDEEEEEEGDTMQEGKDSDSVDTREESAIGERDRDGAAGDNDLDSTSGDRGEEEDDDDDKASDAAAPVAEDGSTSGDDDDDGRDHDAATEADQGERTRDAGGD